MDATLHERCRQAGREREARRSSPGRSSRRLRSRRRHRSNPGDYKVLIRTKGTAALGSTESVIFTLDADPLGTGTLFFFRRIGPREIPTADLRFRRTERLIVESPASLGADIAARLLGRTGTPLNVPVTATIRDDADGTRWRRVEITLAPLAPGEYSRRERHEPGP